MQLSEDALSYLEEILKARGNLEDFYQLPALRYPLDDIRRILQEAGVSANHEELVQWVVQAVGRGELGVGEVINRLRHIAINLQRSETLLRDYAELASWRGDRARIDLLQLDAELERIRRIVEEALRNKLEVEVVNIFGRGSIFFLVVKLSNVGSSVLKPLTITAEGAYTCRVHGSFEKLYPGQNANYVVEVELPTSVSQVILSIRYRNELRGIDTVSTPPIPVKVEEKVLEPDDLLGIPVPEALNLETQPVTYIPYTVDSINNWIVKGELGRGGRCEVLLVEKEGKRGAMKLPIEAWETGKGFKPKAIIRQDVSDNIITYWELLKKLGRIKLVHVVEPLDGGFWEGAPYVVEEYCEKGSLARVIRERGSLTLKSALLIGIQLAQTLLAAYEHAGVKAHNDVKPENVLFDSGGVVHLTDFHAARALDVTVSRDRIPGTPYYSDFENVDERSDVKGLARTIADALVGLDWRRRGSPLEDIARIQPVELKELIYKACSPNRRERPTMKAFLSGLVAVYQESSGHSGFLRRR
ncbi:MAG: protein kinase [Thermofilaceae archaeon]